jgi:hypothetical protein
VVEMAITKDTFRNQLIAIALVLGIPLAGLTYNTFLTSELKDYYICTANSGKYAGQYFEFKGGLSKTLTRGYPYSGSTLEYKDCLVPWITLLQECKNLYYDDPYVCMSYIDSSNAKITKSDISNSKSSGICNTEGCIYP